MELVQQLKEDGKAKGLCRMWQMKLKTGLDYEQLIQLYIRGIDFCISENYPTLDFIREHFKGKCEVYGVFVDDEVTSYTSCRGRTPRPRPRQAALPRGRASALPGSTPYRTEWCADPLNRAGGSTPVTFSHRSRAL